MQRKLGPSGTASPAMPSTSPRRSVTRRCSVWRAEALHFDNDIARRSERARKKLERRATVIIPTMSARTTSAKRAGGDRLSVAGR
jgi:hypothetical protein